RRRNQLRDETRVCHVDAISLPSQNRRLLDPVGDIRTRGDQEAVDRGRDPLWRSIGPDFRRTIRIRYIEIAGAQHQCAAEAQGRDCFHDWFHGQNPKSIEKKKLRFGGNGATSMFRAIAWLPKLDTSGSMPG